MAFDVDGTLIRGDSLVWFVTATAGLASAAQSLLGAAFHHPMKGSLRDRGKSAVLDRLFQGQSSLAVSESGWRLARRLSTSRVVRRPVLQRLRSHVAEGSYVVLVSASPEPYIAPLAEIWGCAAGLGTRLEADADGLLTGRIDGLNCRGAEKARRLRDHLTGRGLDGSHIWAYGDSAGDRELLEMADRGILVRRWWQPLHLARGRFPVGRLP